MGKGRDHQQDASEFIDLLLTRNREFINPVTEKLFIESIASLDPAV